MDGGRKCSEGGRCPECACRLLGLAAACPKLLIVLKKRPLLAGCDGTMPREVKLGLVGLMHACMGAYCTRSALALRLHHQQAAHQQLRRLITARER